MYIGDEPMSRRTFALIAGGGAFLVVFALTGLVGTGLLPAGQVAPARALLTDAGAIICGLLAAGTLFFTASRFRSDNPLRRIWLLLGTGIATYAVGDMIWTVLEVKSHFGEVPYPSAADLPYLLFYVFMVAGLARAAKAFGRSAHVDRAVKLDIVVMFAFSALVYAFIAAPIIVDVTASLPVKILGVTYPILDIAALLGPAVFIAVVASSISRTHCMRHWWVLTGGIVIMSLTDIAFTRLDWVGLYTSGDLVDYAWMLSLIVIAVAGSMAADVAIEQSRATAAIAKGPRLHATVDEDVFVPKTGLIFLPPSADGTM
jgi:hypothetical protein